jgi:hypothetical protein
MSQWRDVNGKPEIDAPLYIYEANTDDPVTIYKDSGLSLEHPWPLRSNSQGMIPAFWLPDGSYRARLTNAAASLIYFDELNILAIGPSSGEGGGGGGGSVDQNAIFATGDLLWQPKAGTRAGWVRANGRTIGSASSGATERANADTQALYEFLWNNYSNTLCAVTGGRGANAASDFAANKAIATYSMRGRGPVGLDDMGNSAAGVLTDGTPTAISFGGQEKTSITIAQANLPNVTLGGNTAAGGAHRHFEFADVSSTDDTTPTNSTQVQRTGQGSGTSARYAMTGTATEATVGRTSLASDHSHSFTTSSINGGVSQTAIEKNVTSPYMLGTWYIRL